MRNTPYHAGCKECERVYGHAGEHGDVASPGTRSPRSSWFPSATRRLPGRRGTPRRLRRTCPARADAGVASDQRRDVCKGSSRTGCLCVSVARLHASGQGLEKSLSIRKKQRLARPHGGAETAGQCNHSAACKFPLLNAPAAKPLVPPASIAVRVDPPGRHRQRGERRLWRS